MAAYKISAQERARADEYVTMSRCAPRRRAGRSPFHGPFDGAPIQLYRTPGFDLCSRGDFGASAPTIYIYGFSFLGVYDLVGPGSTSKADFLMCLPTVCTVGTEYGHTISDKRYSTHYCIHS